MQTASRPHDLGRGQPGKRGHVPQLSISDDNHHVTEAIGDMYGDHHYGRRDSGSGTASFAERTSPTSPQPHPLRTNQLSDSQPSKRPSPIIRTTSSERALLHTNGQSIRMAAKRSSVDRGAGSISRNRSLHDEPNSDTANHAFPLNDIDYESNPVAVAQELSNLQALRRMSMDVNTSRDPDLPSFNSNFGIPSTSPSGADDEDDQARLFWVPARLHPELAPTEFKTFLDGKVDSIKRRSEERSLSPESLKRDGSGGGLRRRKSMLSRQIDNSGGRGADGYQDGAERLERKRSQSSGETLKNGMSNLSELEELVNGPEDIIQRLSIDTSVTDNFSMTQQPSEDMPILPAAPKTNSLRRSTRTTYRRGGGGSLKKGERAIPSRKGARSSEPEGDEPPMVPPITPVEEPLSRIQTEPAPTSERVTENFSRPGRINRRGMPPKAHQAATVEQDLSRPSTSDSQASTTGQRHFVSQIASNGRTTASPQAAGRVPQIVETPHLVKRQDQLLDRDSYLSVFHPTNHLQLYHRKAMYPRQVEVQSGSRLQGRYKVFEEARL